MNIFVLDNDPKICSQYHCNKHTIKMILESAQILCCVFHSQGFENVPYRKTHFNHPCSIWVRESPQNFLWGLELLKELLIEYTYRYGKIHKTSLVYDWIVENYSLLKFDKNDFTEQPKCMPDKYKVDSVVESYRNYYIGDKAKIAEWTKREIPEWFKVVGV